MRLLSNSSRTVFWIGTTTYAALLLLAGAFYLERTCFLDTAFQTFVMLKDHDFAIMVGRFGAALTQVFPVTAQALGLPLKWVLLSYSLGFIVFYYGVFLACLWWFRNQSLALVMLLYSTLMTTQTFYWMQSEIIQGIALVLAWFAWLHTKKSLGALRWWDWILLPATALTLVYIHPLTLFPVVFLSLFFLLEKNPPTGWRKLHFVALGVFIAGVLLKNKILKLNWYDASAMKRSDNLWKLFPNWFDLQSNRDFLAWCTGDYLLLALLFAAVLVALVWKRLWLKALLVAGFFVAYVLFVNVSFAAGDRQFYLEAMYLPLTIFVAAPFVYDVLPLVRLEKWRWSLMSALLVIGVVRIGLAHRPWTARLDWAKGLLRETAAWPQRKLILAENQVPMDKLQLSWATSFEFLLLSSLENADSVRCITVDEDPARFTPLLDKRRTVLMEFKNYDYTELPKRYFNLTDTSAYIFYPTPKPAE